MTKKDGHPRRFVTTKELRSAAFDRKANTLPVKQAVASALSSQSMVIHQPIRILLPGAPQAVKAVDGQSIDVQDLSERDLEAIVYAFRSDLFKRAGKVAPTIRAPEGIE